MDMEAQEETFMESNNIRHKINKAKPTKRQRSSSPPHKAVATVTSSSSSGGCGGGGRHRQSISASSPTISCSNEICQEEDQEEVDMANCLILLAQSNGLTIKQTQQENDQEKKKEKEKKLFSRKVGFHFYECKTCNRSFPSFQALGGHRASHKKPKTTVVDEKKPPHTPPLTVAPPVLSLDFLADKGFLGNKSKIHECSICGSEFTSGQALGGHMRRHRANTANNDQIKPRNILALDLNLPAPEEDQHHHYLYHHHRETKFQLAGTTPQTLVFSAAPALVDCHY